VPGSTRHGMKPDRRYTRHGVRVTYSRDSLPLPPLSYLSLASLVRDSAVRRRSTAPDPASSPPPSLTADAAAAWTDLCFALFGSVALAQLRAHLETLTTVPQRRC
jgi:hypothetical protein